MSEHAHIKAKVTRVVQAFDAKPHLAKSTDVTSLSMGEGLACTATQGNWSQAIDMPAAMGGTETGPTPGFLGRACVIGCMAMGIKLVAAMDDIEISGMTVDMETDFDDRGLVGFDGIDAGCMGSRVVIKITSPHSQAEIETLVDKALARDPWYLSYIRAQDIATVIEVNDTAEVG